MCTSIIKLYIIIGTKPVAHSHYVLLTFYKHTPNERVWLVCFAVTKNMDEHIKVCKNVFVFIKQII